MSTLADAARGLLLATDGHDESMKSELRIVKAADVLRVALAAHDSAAKDAESVAREIVVAHYSDNNALDRGTRLIASITAALVARDARLDADRARLAEVERDPAGLVYPSWETVDALKDRADAAEAKAAQVRQEAFTRAAEIAYEFARWSDSKEPRDDIADAENVIAERIAAAIEKERA